MHAAAAYVSRQAHGTNLARDKGEEAMTGPDTSTGAVDQLAEWARTHDMRASYGVVAGTLRALAVERDAAYAREAALRNMRLHQIKAVWKSAGGEWHGPHIEHWSIPEDRVVDFIKALLARASLENKP